MLSDVAVSVRVHTEVVNGQYVDMWPQYMSRDMKKQQNDCTPIEDSDQPGHQVSLIRVFAVRMKNAWALSHPLGVHSFWWFCHVVADIE